MQFSYRYINRKKITRKIDYIMSFKLINKIYDDIIALKNDEKPLFIGVDGPTAAGKTFLAKNLKKKLLKVSKPVWICQLDWSLKSRIYRSKSLEEFKSSGSNFFFESQDHMNLNKISNCLKKIKNHDFSKKNFIKIKLNYLYDRQGSSKNDLSVSTKIYKNTIILVEGHYTSKPEFDEVIDYNILLLGKKKKLLERKINKVKHYRSVSETIEYFYLIDVPSFVNHLSLYFNNYDLIVDNTSYLRPIIKNKEYPRLWMSKVFNKKPLTQNNLDKFIKSNFYPLIINSLNLKYFFKIFENEIIKFDEFVSNNIKINIQEINIDLTNFLNQLVDRINRKINKNKTKLYLDYTDNFHKIYYKMPPFFVGFRLVANDYKEASGSQRINFIAKIKNKEIVIDIYWKGGVETIFFKRDLGIAHNKYEFQYEKKNIKRLEVLQNKKKELIAFIPTNFMYFTFLDHYYKVKQIFTNKFWPDKDESTISASEIIENFYGNEIFWVHRFTKFCERDFFQNIVTSIGIKSFSIGNYLISYKLSDRELDKKIKTFFFGWKFQGENFEIFNKSKEHYDQKIEQNRQIFTKFTNSKTKLFGVFDNSLFIKKGSFFNTNQNLLVKDLKTLLGSKNRNVRKGITLLIDKNFNNLALNIDELWKDKIITSKKTITLNSFTNISPSILSDLYFWLSLKKENSSILAANVYDIRKDSFDIGTYLEAAQSINSPIVIQSSFNAIGQKEKKSKIKLEGYLKLKDGPGDFVRNSYESARNIYLKNEKNFLFGFGLDHIDIRYDKPKGRVNKFVKIFQQYNLITHYVLDGSYILEKSSAKNFNHVKKILFNQVMDFELSILKLIKNYDIFDLEFCASELSYVGNDKKIFIPTTKDLLFFSKSLFQKLHSKSLSLINMRPKLIIGNLGTTHHGYDNKTVKVETSEAWIKEIKKFGFVSAVLHGTSRSHPDTLKRSIVGCKKVNVAGDLLDCLVSNLPEKLNAIVKAKNDQEKTKLYLIRKNLGLIPHKKKEEIRNSLNYKCLDLMKSINSPTLTDLDVNYFKYKLYNFDKLQINAITKSVIKEINNLKKININNGRKVNSVFLPSPIEVEFGNYFKSIINSSIKSGFKRFHLDVGDGKFINRLINVENKVSYIKRLSQQNIVHLHLMVINPHYGQKDNYIHRYAKLGADNIGIHRKAFTNNKEIDETINLIKSLNKNVGIFVEINELIDEDLLNIIIKHKINWIVLMGVPVGFGGQFFNEQILFKAKTLRQFSVKNKLDLKIEVDGGLNKDNILLCQKFGVNYLAGWSLVKSQNLKEYQKNLLSINKKLKNG